MRREKAKVVETPVPAKPVVRQHPSKALAKAIVKWMDEYKGDDIAKSDMVKQGIYLAYSDVFDDLPVDFFRRNEVKALQLPNNSLSAIMEGLRVPGVNRVEYLARVFEKVWRHKKKVPEKKAVAQRQRQNHSKTRQSRHA